MKIVISILLCCITLTAFAQDQEADEVKTLLNQFLTKVNSAEMHDRFWAEDLIYTSSAGLRFGKAQIMEGFKDSGSKNADGPTYALKMLWLGYLMTWHCSPLH